MAAGEDAGQIAGHEQAPDRGFDDDGVDHHHDAGGNEHGERRGRRDRSAGELAVVAVAQHLGNSDAPHRACGGDAGARAGAEQRAARDGGHRKSAGKVGEPDARRAEGRARQSRVKGEIAHQQEQRHRGQGVVGDRRIELRRQHREGRLLPRQQEQPAEAYEGERERDRQTQADQHEQGDKPEKADLIAFHGRSRRLSTIEKRVRLHRECRFILRGDPMPRGGGQTFRKCIPLVRRSLPGRRTVSCSPAGPERLPRATNRGEAARPLPPGPVRPRRSRARIRGWP